MTELDLSQVQEVEAQPAFPFPIPPVETLIKQAAINVVKGHDQNNNEMVMMQFITPVMVYTVQLDKTACKALSEEIRPSGIVTATVLPRG